MHINVEIRIPLFNDNDDCAMLVRGNELRRTGQRHLMPTGGGVQATEADLIYFGYPGEVKVKDDLRFEVNEYRRGTMRRFLRGFAPERFTHEAQREFREEMVNERRLLGPEQFEEVTFSFCDSYAFRGASQRHKTLGQTMIYGVGVVKAHAPPETLAVLMSASQNDESVLEFVPPHLLANGGQTNRGSFVPNTYSYLLQ